MPAGFVAVSSYFTTKKGQAIGIAMAGTGLGQMLFPHVIGYLLDEHSYRTTLLITGAIVLNGVVGATLLQPVEWHMVPSPTLDETLLLQKQPNQRQSPTIVPTDTVPKQKPTSIWKKISNQLDLTLLSDWVFLNITLGVSLVYTVSIFFSMLYPFFLQQGPPDLSRGQTAACMSVLAGADMISRLTMPIFTQYFNVSARTNFFFGTMLLGIARSCMAQLDQYVHLLIVSGITGYIRAVTIVNLQLTVAEHVTQLRLPCALGLNMITNGLMLITAGQLLGWVQAYTHNFVIGIHASSCILMLVVVMWLPEMIWKVCFKPASKIVQVEL